MRRRRRYVDDDYSITRVVVATGAGSTLARTEGPLPLTYTPSLATATQAPHAYALLATPGMLLLVDGYNVSLSGWPDLPLDLQRQRLVLGLAGVQARTGSSVVVVFDGAEPGVGLPSESLPRSVQVRFTSPGVEADDELRGENERTDRTARRHNGYKDKGLEYSPGE